MSDFKARWLLVATSILVSAASSCGGTASTVCDLECECEHCNDIKEDFLCSEREAERDIAESYGCVEQWDEWAGCYEERGTCDEKESRFSTQKPGSCSGEQDTMAPCATSAECVAFGAETCTSGTCRQRVCSGNNPSPCQSDSQCSDGTDLCETERVRLQECQVEASDDPRFVGGNGGPQGG